MATITRRSILAGLASAATLATTTANASPTEHPDLLAMADQINPLADAHAKARNRVAAIAEEWGPQWPTPDPQIIYYGNGTQTHRDILGQGVETQWGKGSLMRVQNLGTAEIFQAEYERAAAEADRLSRTKSQRGAKSASRWAERMKDAIEPSRDYWSEVERITSASGIEDAQANETATREALREHINQIMAFEELTIEGLAIKAQALGAWSNVEKFFRHLNPQADDWARGITASILRHTAPATA